MVRFTFAIIFPRSWVICIIFSFLFSGTHYSYTLFWRGYCSIWFIRRVRSTIVILNTTFCFSSSIFFNWEASLTFFRSSFWLLIKFIASYICDNSASRSFNCSTKILVTFWYILAKLSSICSLTCPPDYPDCHHVSCFLVLSFSDSHSEQFYISRISAVGKVFNETFFYIKLNRILLNINLHITTS